MGLRNVSRHSCRMGQIVVQYRIVTVLPLTLQANPL